MRLNPNQSSHDIMHSKVSGIPCLVLVTDYSPFVPAKLSGHPDSWAPSEGGDFSFELYDRKGYRAKWLEEKVTDADIDRLFEAYEKHIEDYYARDY